MRYFLYAMLVVGFLVVPVGAQAEQLTQYQRDVAASAGVPASWMLTGFDCSSDYGCVQRKPVKKTSAQIREENAADARAKREGMIATEVSLRRMGMSSGTARLAVWALANKSNSECANKV